MTEFQPKNVVDKIRKLLAVARDKGADANSAANALALAQQLMLKHNIDESALAKEEELQAVRGRWVSDIDNKWRVMLASACAELYTCRLVMMTGGIGMAQFAGRPMNVEACELTLPWLIEQVEEQYKIGLRAFRGKMGSLTKEERGNFRKSFKEGCAMTVWARASEIVAQMKNEIPAHRALVVIDQSLAAADDLLSGLKQRRDLVSPKTGFGTGAGLAAGMNINLQEQVEK